MKSFKLYCKKYHSALLGGKNKNRSLFDGSPITRFAVQVENQIDEINIIEGLNLNEYQDYIINLQNL